MTEIDISCLCNDLLSHLPTTYYTVPVNARVIVREVLLCNTSSVNDNTVTLHYVPAGEDLGPENMVLCELEIGPKETVALDFATVINEGGTIQGSAVYNAEVSLRVSGILVE